MSSLKCCQDNYCKIIPKENKLPTDISVLQDIFSRKTISKNAKLSFLV